MAGERGLRSRTDSSYFRDFQAEVERMPCITGCPVPYPGSASPAVQRVGDVSAYLGVRIYWGLEELPKACWQASKGSEGYQHDGEAVFLVCLFRRGKNTAELKKSQEMLLLCGTVICHGPRGSGPQHCWDESSGQMGTNRTERAVSSPGLAGERPLVTDTENGEVSRLSFCHFGEVRRKSPPAKCCRY